jgi:hypothetical protein
VEPTPKTSTRGAARGAGFTATCLWHHHLRRNTVSLLPYRRALGPSRLFAVMQILSRKHVMPDVMAPLT